MRTRLSSGRPYGHHGWPWNQHSPSFINWSTESLFFFGISWLTEFRGWLLGIFLNCRSGLRCGWPFFDRRIQNLGRTNFGMQTVTKGARGVRLWQEGYSTTIRKRFSPPPPSCQWLQRLAGESVKKATQSILACGLWDWPSSDLPLQTKITKKRKENKNLTRNFENAFLGNEVM